MKADETRRESAAYEIIFQGHLDERRAEWFAGMQVECLAGGNTRLTGEIIDQAALYGILSRIRDLGLPLLWVCREDFCALEFSVVDNKLEE